MAVTAAKPSTAFRGLTMAVNLSRLTTGTMDSNDGHEKTSKASIILQFNQLEASPNKEVQALKNWLSIRTSYPHAESEWVFLSRKGNPLSRQQFYHIISTSGGNAGLSLEIHPHMLRHSCGFALANMGIDTRLIQDYLGHRNIRHTVWYTASNAGRFYGIWDRARGRQRHAVL
ncbi:tyrosine-type DNA invertase [Escherichia coli]